MESTVFPTALFADGLRDSELEKSALQMVIVRVVQFLLLLPLSGHNQCLVILPLSGGSGILHKSYLLQNGQKYTLITNPNYGGAAGRLPTFTLHLLY